MMSVAFPDVAFSTVSFSRGIVQSRGNRKPESEKSDVGISHQTENEKDVFVYEYVQKEAAPTAAAAAAAAAVEKQKEKKKPKLEKHGHINTQTILEFPDKLIGKRAPPRELQLQQDHHVRRLYSSRAAVHKKYSVLHRCTSPKL